METQAPEQSRPFYAERDLLPIPENVPQLGVEKGNEGVIEKLAYQNDRVYASVLVTYSTRQPRGSVLVSLKPEQKVLSYTSA